MPTNVHPTQSVTRRSLLSVTAAIATTVGTASIVGAGTAVAASGHRQPGSAHGQRLAGVQLYTLRSAMEQDMAGTLRAVAGLDYGEVEFAGYFGHEPAKIRALLDELGLSSPSAHIDARQLRDDPSAMIEAASVVGHRFLTIGWIPEELRQSAEDWQGWADTLNQAGQAASAAGIKVAYHNHEFELLPMDGQIPMDILLSQTEPDLVDFELDFFWARKAEKDILEVLGRAPERFTMAHIKDMSAAGEMVSVGLGTIDFAALLKDPVAASLKHLFVEHDNPEDAFKSVAISRYAMRNILD